MSIKALHYKTIETIQEGRISTVYKVKDIVSDDILALKIFTNVDIEDIKSSLKPEVLFEITRISHPNLISIYDYGIYNSQFYLLSEFGYSQSLRNLNLAEQTKDDLLDVLVQICYALDYLHKNRLLHKDLKLENVLFRCDESHKIVVQVCDFGFNKIISTEEAYTEAEKTNLPYSAPETLQEGDFSRKSDFYSLGILLFRLIVGNFPFTQKEIMQIARGEIANIIPQFPQKELPLLDRTMKDLISWLISYNKKNRPGNSKEIIEFINQKYNKNYSVSRGDHLLSQIRSAHYKIRDKDVKSFQKYVDTGFRKGKGALILFSGDTGVGKRQTMQYLKWYLLSSDSYVIYYNCSKIHKDPFFMLTKEIFLTNEGIGKDFIIHESSERLNKFLFDSESVALDIEEDEENLERDFDLVWEYLVSYSKTKPIIFFISNITSANQETIDFIRFISEDISRHNILIAISTPEESLFEDVNDVRRIPINSLTKSETNEFVEQLLDADISKPLLDKLFFYSNGNQLLIQQLVLQFIETGVIKQINSKWVFKKEVQQIEIPQKAEPLLKRKIKKILPEDRRNLSQLAVLQVPISKELVQHVLKFDNMKEVFFFLERCKKNSTLVLNEKYAEDGYYKFIHPWMKLELAGKIPLSETRKISKMVVDYFADKPITDLTIMDGIIEHCIIAENKRAQVDFKLLKINLYIDRKDFVYAWRLSNDMFTLVSSLRNKLTKKKLRKYISLFLFLSRILEKYKPKKIEQFSDLIGKNADLLLPYAEQFFNKDYDRAKSLLDALEKKVKSPKIAQIQFAYLKLFCQNNKIGKAKEKLELIDISNFSAPDRAKYYYFKGITEHLEASYKDSTESLTRAVEFVTDSNNAFLLSQIYAELADVYNKINKMGNANKFYLKSIENCVTSGNILTLAKSYLNWALMLNKTGQLSEALGKLHNSKYYFQEVENKKGLANVNLQIAQINYKMGNFQESDKYYKYALDLSLETKNNQLTKKIKEKFSFLYGEIQYPHKFNQYLRQNYLEYFEEDSILHINSFTKSYIFSLDLYGDADKIAEILQSIEEQEVDCTLEEEFLQQTRGFIAKAEGDLKNAEKCFNQALEIATENKNNYAVMIEHFNLADVFYKSGNLKQATMQCKFARAIARKNSFGRWNNFARLINAMISLKKEEINLRSVLRSLHKCRKISSKMKDWMIQLKALALITLTYRSMKSVRNEKKYRNKFHKFLDQVVEGLNEKDKKVLGDHFFVSYIAPDQDFSEVVSPRKQISADMLQHSFLELLQHKKLEQIKFNLQKLIKNYLGAYKFEISIFDEKDRRKRIWFDGGIEIFELIHKTKLDQAWKNHQIQYYKYKNIHYCHIPLFLKNEIIGFLSICDAGEMSFTYSEKKRIKTSAFYLAVILKKLDEFQQIVKQGEQVTDLLSISRELLQIMDLDRMKSCITKNAINLTGAEKGFFLSVDENKNIIFDVGIFNSGEKIESRDFEVKKDIVRQIYSQVTSRSGFTLTRDQMLVSTKEEGKLLSIFCTPLIVKNNLFGFVYLEDTSGKIPNSNFKLLEIFILMSETAIKNCLDYDELREANEKLLNIDQDRAQFINISSHEFNTPVQILKGYIKIIKDENSSDKLRNNAIRVMENNINRLSHCLDNILQMNAADNDDFSITEEELNLKDILKIVQEDMEVAAKSRKQKLLLELPDELPPVKAERISLLNAIKNLVLNSIKFTNDYGEIRIGARRSLFSKEEINNEKSLVIYVKDNGIGIPTYELDNIFKEFYEVADIKSHHSGVMEFKSSGLGLGLPLTKSIVKMFDGKIWVKSIKGEGSTFYIALPESATSKNKK